MSDRTPPYDLESAALKWLRLREECRRLWAERSASGYCKHEIDGERMTPCWKTYVDPSTGRPAGLQNWCEPCQRRQSVHEVLRDRARSRGAALRHLIACYQQRKSAGEATVCSECAEEGR